MLDLNNKDISGQKVLGNNNPHPKTLHILRLHQSLLTNINYVENKGRKGDRKCNLLLLLKVKTSHLNHLEPGYNILS